jgi:CubicO group peptidase (beta-lactamase class C family)
MSLAIALLCLRNFHQITDVWKIEIEDRDSPQLLTLTLEKDQSKLRLGKSNISLAAVKSDSNGISLRVSTNFFIGKGDIEMKFRGDRLVGTIRTDKFRENVNARRAGAGVIAKSKESPVNGPGFRNLLIKGKTLNERMQVQNTPGVSMAAFNTGGYIEAGYFGVQNSETLVPVSEKTLFQAGGMGSVLTCLAALKLAGEGKLDLNSKVNNHLVGWTIPARKSGEVRISDLLSGTSGLSQYKFRGYSSELRSPTLNELFQGKDKLQMEPVVPTENPDDLGFRGINHAILQQVLENVTGKPFDDLMKEVIFRPLGLKLSTFNQNPKGSNISSGHYEVGEPIFGGHHVYPMAGESGLWTNAKEVSLVLVEASKLLTGKANKILLPNKMYLLKMASSKFGTAGFVSGGDGFYFHGGDTYGFFCNFSINTIRGNGVVIMTNRVMNWRFFNEVKDAAQLLNP